jgi:molybdate transport system substrate-binding protein
VREGEQCHNAGQRFAEANEPSKLEISTMRRIFLPAVAVAVLFCATGPAWAQSEVTLIAPGGIRSAVEKAIPGFEKKTGIKVNATFGSGGGTHKQVASGEVFDVPIVQPPYDDVVASGNVLESSATPLASVAVGIAVKQGAPKPDISTPQAVKKMLLSAKSIAIPDASLGAAAGVTINKMLKDMGIADQVEPKLLRPRGTGPGGAGGGNAATALVASGGAELVMTFYSEMDVPGVDKVGMLPKEVSPRTALVGFISSHAKNPEGAKALLAYLASPEAMKIYKEVGMEPAK